MSSLVNQMEPTPQSRSRRISIAELAHPGGGGFLPGSVGSRRTSAGGSFSGSSGTPRFAQLSRRVTRLIGLQKSLRGSAIREDSGGRPGADDFMSRMRPDEAPRNPRFSTTLSTEGQYATFKCYERLARNCALSAEPVGHPPLRPHELPHTRTPMEMVRTRFELTNPPQQKPQHRVGRGTSDEASADDTGSRSQSRQSRQSLVWGGLSRSNLEAGGHQAAEIPLPGHSLTAYAPSRQHRRISRERRGTPTGPEADETQQQPRNAQLERQIRQSYRLENVMEIIDHVRNKRGQAVTNQRFLRHRIQPAEHYQMWVRLWNKDFVVRPRGPGEEGALKSYVYQN